MADYTGLRESTGTRADNVGVYDGVALYSRGTGPRTYSTPVLVDHSGAETHNTAGGTTENYSNGSTLGILKGYAVYAKSGNTVFYYEDSLGAVQVGPSGGTGGQNNAPSRSATGEKAEFVGIFTGRATSQFIEVSWVNTWWQDFKAKFPPWKSVKAHTEAEQKVSWVKISTVEWQSDYQSDEDRSAELEKEKLVQAALNDTSNNTGGTNAGIDSTTLGLIAVGGAFLLRNKKKRKK